MSKTDAFEAALLDLIFINSNIANLGDATGVRGSTVAGSLYFSLHSADPGEAGTQSTNEVAYTGYARVAVTRGAGFSRSGNQITPASAVNFPPCTAGTVTATHFGIGVSSSGANLLLYKAALSPTIAISAGVTPQLTTATAVTED